MGQEIHRKHWTNADWFSFFGFLVYFSFTFIGFTLKFSLVGSFIFTSLITAFFWLALVVLKKLKKVEDDIKKWRWLEWIVCIIVLPLLLCAGNRPMYWTLSTVVIDSNTLKEAADEDIECMGNLFTDYEKYEAESIEKTHTVLKNFYLYNKRNQDFKNILSCHFGRSDSLQKNEIDNYCNNMYVKYLSGNAGQRSANNLEGDYQTFNNRKMKTIKKIRSSATSLNFYQIPQLVMEFSPLCIEETGNSIAAFLTEKSQARKYVDGNSYPFKFDGEGKSLEREYIFRSKFKERIDAMLGSKNEFFSRQTLLGLIVNIFMLFSYFVSKRSAKVEIARGRNRIHIGDGMTYLD